MAVAQLGSERLDVTQEVEGSIPSGHPNSTNSIISFSATVYNTEGCSLALDELNEGVRLNVDIIASLRPLDVLPDDKLRDRDELRRVIAECGLNGEFAGDWPQSLYKHLGGGLRVWQYPVQFADYLIFLSRFKVSRYLEIGARDGGTMVLTVAYLSRFHPLVEAIGVDIETESAVCEIYRSLNPVCSFVVANSQTEGFGKFLRNYDFDLVLVDGEHSVKGMVFDFENAAASGAKLISCHDIWNNGLRDQCCKGWMEIKKRYNRDYYFVEFVGQYDEMRGFSNYPNLGMGLAVRSDCYV